MKVTATHASIKEAFELLLKNEGKMAQLSLKERKALLKRLENTVLKYRKDIQEALFADFKKIGMESDFVDIYPIVSACRYARSHLKWWMRDKHVSTPLIFLGARSFVRYEAKGVSLILSPWNYPVTLSLSPLVSAIAAGCPVILKPSEFTPNVSAVLETIVSEVFEKDQVIVIQRGVEVSTSLLEQPFRHIFFTGSPKVGKVVMTAAATHLSSVTLELGGKSPAIVDKSAHIPSTARRIVTTKWANAGQTCVAPDYVMVHESIRDALVQEIKEILLKRYSKTDWSTAYTGMIDDERVNEMHSLVEDAVLTGAEVWQVPHAKIEGYYSPTLLTSPDENSRVLTEEIFGPILPIVVYSELNEVTDFIHKRPRPLSMGIFSRNADVTRELLSQTRAGNTGINHLGVHFYNPNLPFGGVNGSGIGKGHGRDGFIEFTNQRAIFKQLLRFSPHEVLVPPLSPLLQRIVDIVLKWM